MERMRGFLYRLKNMVIVSENDGQWQETTLTQERQSLLTYRADLPPIILSLLIPSLSAHSSPRLSGNLKNCQIAMIPGSLAGLIPVLQPAWRNQNPKYFARQTFSWYYLSAFTDFVVMGDRFKKHIKELLTSILGGYSLVTKKIHKEEATGQAVLTFIVVSKQFLHIDQSHSSFRITKPFL